jgi:hypothetical protein
VLQKHEQRLGDLYQEANDQTAIPISESDASDMHDWVDSKKTILNEIEGDLRDGKRRVTAAKGPRKKVPADEPAQSSEGEGEGSGSEED